MCGGTLSARPSGATPCCSQPERNAPSQKALPPATRPRIREPIGAPCGGNISPRAKPEKTSIKRGAGVLEPLTPDGRLSRLRLGGPYRHHLIAQIHIDAAKSEAERVPNS